MTVTTKDILSTFKEEEIIEVDGQLVDPKKIKYENSHVDYQK